MSTPIVNNFVAKVYAAVVLVRMPGLFNKATNAKRLLRLTKRVKGALKRVRIPSLVVNIVTLMVLLTTGGLVPGFPVTIMLVTIKTLVAGFLPIER